MVRPRAEMMPAVTVCERPSGLPIATTQSPTATASLSPRGTGVMSSGGSIFTTPTSVIGSVPRTLPSTILPFHSSTSIASFSLGLVPATTWLFVRIVPDLSMMKPEPRPFFRVRFFRFTLMMIVTIAGSAVRASGANDAGAPAGVPVAMPIVGEATWVAAGGTSSFFFSSVPPGFLQLPKPESAPATVTSATILSAGLIIILTSSPQLS